MNKYDAIVVGAGHNGLTNAAYLAKAGLKGAVLERNPHIGGATVSRELYEGWHYSNCSYVSCLLRPEITRSLELPHHGLQVAPTPPRGSESHLSYGSASAPIRIDRHPIHAAVIRQVVGKCVMLCHAVIPDGH